MLYENYNFYGYWTDKLYPEFPKLQFAGFFYCQRYLDALEILRKSTAGYNQFLDLIKRKLDEAMVNQIMMAGAAQRKAGIDQQMPGGGKPKIEIAR